MLKNMKMKKSLVLQFACTILIFTVITIITLFMMNSQRASFISLINNEGRASTLIASSRMNANIAARNLRDIALFPDDPENASKESRAYEVLQNLTDDITELREAYEGDTSMLDNYTKALNDWGSMIPTILQAIDEGRTAEALDMIKNECTPKLNAMAEHAQNINNEINRIETESISKTQRTMTITIIIIAVVLVIVIALVMAVTVSLIKSIVGPAEEISVALKGFSEGDLHIPVKYESKSELGEMCDAMRRSQNVLGSVIEDICYLLSEMAKGNFNVRTKDANMYVGSLSSVLESVRTINHSLSDTLAQISQSAEQVSADAEQVSTSAQALAQGATEQASAVQELSATISEISNNVRENAKNSEMVMARSQSAGEQVGESAHYMEQMVAAMQNISESSEEIGKIIATIENIAFQTNILALNAAVEAARAGAAGKGFAVVADEVRNLASKSDEASKATKDLIERSVMAVKEGEDIVKNVSDALNRTIATTEEAVNGIKSITNAVEEESESIAQITEGIDQISSVVQTNSATSEQSAAASEELSSQATLMKELMRRFKLRDSDMSYGSTPVAAPSYKDTYVAEETYDASGDSYSAFSKY